LIKYCEQALEQTDFLMSKSYIYATIKGISRFLQTSIKNRSLVKAFKILIDDISKGITDYLSQRDKKKQITMFNDLPTIIIIILAYIGTTKIEVYYSLKVFLAYQIIDFGIRLLITLMIYISKEN